MTMHVVYLKNHDGHEEGKDYFVERTLGRRLCANGVTLPYSDWVKRVVVEEVIKDPKEEEVKPKPKPKPKRKPVKRTVKPEKAISVDKGD
jgi:hypothetical protein